MKRYDVVVPKKDAHDPNKTYWKQVGTLVKFEATQEKPEGFILELHMFPDTTFKVFEQKPKVESPKAADEAWDAAIPSTPVQPTPADINSDDIPF
jgi:hypothetical protein